MIQNADGLDTRYITTYSYGGLDGYLVRVPRYTSKSKAGRKWHSKLFTFKKFSSNKEALEAAIEYRDKWYIDHAEDMRLRPAGVIFDIKLPSNNKSGIVGINRTERRVKSGNIETQWQTTFPGLDNKPVNSKFSVYKYGEIGALRRAIEARRDGLLDYLTSIDDEDVDVNLDVISFYEDILSNLRGYSDDEDDSPIIEIVKNNLIDGTTKLDQILVRVGHQRFRREVLAIFENKCAITGSSLLVRASHIKPWRIANDQERLDPANGLALSPVYDAAFDLGLISFTPDGRVMLSTRIQPEAENLGISNSDKLRFLSEGHQKYLSWHRKNIFLNDG